MTRSLTHHLTSSTLSSRRVLFGSDSKLSCLISLIYAIARCFTSATTPTYPGASPAHDGSRIASCSHDELEHRMDHWDNDVDGHPLLYDGICVLHDLQLNKYYSQHIVARYVNNGCSCGFGKSWTAPPVVCPATVSTLSHKNLIAVNKWPPPGSAPTWTLYLVKTAVLLSKHQSSIV